MLKIDNLFAKIENKSILNGLNLDIKPGEAVYVGDNQFDDVKGAKSVGMFTVLLNRNGNTLDDNITKPDYELTSFDDLLAILKRCR